jgi:hypothetical protein
MLRPLSAGGRSGRFRSGFKFAMERWLRKIDADDSLWDVFVVNFDCGFPGKLFCSPAASFP